MTLLLRRMSTGHCQISKYHSDFAHSHHHDLVFSMLRTNIFYVCIFVEKCKTNYYELSIELYSVATLQI